MNHAASDRVVADGQRVFEAMADVAPVMIWQSGPDKLTTYFNRSWLDFTGRTVQQEGVAKSLVQADQQPDSVRYNYLETVREYALEQLAASGVRPLIERRHARYMLALAELAPSDVSGLSVRSPCVADSVGDGGAAALGEYALTSRDREVIQLLSRGLSTRQIAAQLVISPGTVRSHLDHVMARFDLHSRVQVVAWATQDRFDPGTSR